MADNKRGHDRGGEQPLKGTFASVLLLAAIIAGSWLGVYVLFLARG